MHRVEALQRIVNRYSLQHYAEPNELMDEDPELALVGYTPSSNHTIQELLTLLNNNAKQINDQLTFVNKVMVFKLDGHDFEPTAIKSFLESVVANSLPNKDYKVVTSGEDVVVDINTFSIKEMISNSCLMLNVMHLYLQLARTSM